MGIRNTYRKGMPVTEQFLKDIVHSLSSVKKFFTNGLKTKKLFIFPDYPSKKTSIYKVSERLNYVLSNKGRKSASLYVYWEDTTFSEFDFGAIAHDNPKKIINEKCSDISKEKVDAMLQKVFGYSTIVDPKLFVGKAVQKSDINALHDGEVIVLPIQDPKEGKIYQLLIDNATSEKEVVDLRIPIVREALDFVYLKYKDTSVRFDNVTTNVELKSVVEIFSLSEIKLINAFCIEMGLEYGEIDILRDNDSSKIYIIDVNKTPYGPPEGLNQPDSKNATGAIAKAFEKEFLQA